MVIGISFISSFQVCCLHFPICLLYYVIFSFKLVEASVSCIQKLWKPAHMQYWMKTFFQFQYAFMMSNIAVNIIDHCFRKCIRQAFWYYIHIAGFFIRIDENVHVSHLQTRLGRKLLKANPLAKVGDLGTQQLTPASLQGTKYRK